MTYALQIDGGVLGLHTAVKAIFEIRRASGVGNFVIIPEYTEIEVNLVLGEGEVFLTPSTVGSIYQCKFVREDDVTVGQFFFEMPSTNVMLSTLKKITAWPNKLISNDELNEKIEDHKDDLANPHQVTAEQVGLGNVQESIDQLRTKIELDTVQIKQYAQFLQKLRTRQPVNIHCVGTSITEGHDTVSPDRRFITINSGVNIAKKTYPEQMQNYLRQTYDTNNINVVNRGWSGHTVYQGLNTWTQQPTNCDLAILEYGANDNNINVPIADFVATYEQLIIRFLKWGIPCIILTPTKPAAADNDSRDAFANSTFLLTQKYSIPWINLELMIKNYGNGVYSDTVHLNGTGYSILGTKIAATLIGEGAHYPKIVSSGSALLSRPMIDNIVYGRNSLKTLTASLGQTPNEVSAAGNGIVASIYGQEGEAWVTYSFYASTDNLSIIPNVFVRPNATIEFVLDGGFVVAQDSMDLMIDETQAVESGNAIYSFTNSTANPIILSKQNQATPVIKCVTEGWHTLRIRSLNAHSDLYGLEFITQAELLTYRNLLKVRNFYSLTVGTDNVASFPTTNILLSDLLSQFIVPFDAFEYWKNPSLKVTITAPLLAVQTYFLIIGSRDPAVPDELRNFKIAFTGHRYDVGVEVTDSDIRFLESVGYTHSTGMLTFNWAGNTARRGNVTITLA